MSVKKLARFVLVGTLGLTFGCAQQPMAVNPDPATGSNAPKILQQSPDSIPADQMEGAEEDTISQEGQQIQQRGRRWGGRYGRYGRSGRGAWWRRGTYWSNRWYGARWWRNRWWRPQVSGTQVVYIVVPEQEYGEPEGPGV